MVRLTNADIAGFRRSLAMSPSLPRDQLDQLLDELEVLLAERARTVATLERLAPSVAEVRAALNDLHRTIQP